MKSMLKSLMSVAVAALAFTSCSNDATEEVIPSGGSKTLVVNATIDQTRTVMADNHIDLKWAEGDQIHLYIGETATQAQVIDNTIGEKITDVTYNGNENVYAYYSTKAGNKVSDGVKKVLLNIPSKQTQTKADVFAGEYMPMAASGTIQNSTVTLAFKPLACVLVFNVYGPAQNETIKSIKFETSVGCCGYDSNGCDLTVNPVQYKPYTTKSATVTLTEPAAIVAAKPDDTKPEGTQIGSGNQVYLVVAPVNYEEATFTVTTDAGEYTFTTANGIDCSTNTARVVNLNLAKSPDFKKEIVVPDVPEQPSEGGNKVIEGITFKHVATDGLTVNIYSDQELTKEDVDWLTISDNITELTTNGTLHYELKPNTNAEARTAYIVIKCGDIQSPPIAVKQVGAGSEPVKVLKASLTFADITGFSWGGSAYKDFSITATDGSVWTGYCAGSSKDDGYLQMGWNTSLSKNASKSYVLIPDAGKVVKKITFTPNGSTNTKDRVLAILPEDFTYTGQSATDVKATAYAYSTDIVNGSTEPISIDLTDKNLKRFMIRAVGATVYLTNITIEYAE